MVFEEAPRIPGKHKNAVGHHDAEHFSDAVEQNVTITAGEKEPDKNYGSQSQVNVLCRN
jgi:hypothetical protein